VTKPISEAMLAGELMAWFQVWTILLVRMVGLVVFLPLIPRTLGVRFRLGLALLLSWVLASSLDSETRPVFAEWPWMQMPGEFLLGALLGLGVSLVLASVRLCAEILEWPGAGTQSGEDGPFLGSESGPVGSLLSWLTALVFLAGGGHLQVVMACRELVQAYPPGTSVLQGNLAGAISTYCQSATLLGLRLAAPVWGASAVVMLMVSGLGRIFPMVPAVTTAIPWKAAVCLVGLSVSLPHFTRHLDREVKSLADSVPAWVTSGPGATADAAGEMGHE
jgi:flagellar biosynthesis protein FliR